MRVASSRFSARFVVMICSSVNVTRTLSGKENPLPPRGTPAICFQFSVSLFDSIQPYGLGLSMRDVDERRIHIEKTSNLARGPNSVLNFVRCSSELERQSS